MEGSVLLLFFGSLLSLAARIDATASCNTTCERPESYKLPEELVIVNETELIVELRCSVACGEEVGDPKVQRIIHGRPGCAGSAGGVS